MNSRRPLWILLSLTLLLGQWLTLAHATEHMSGNLDDGICTLCLQTQNLEQAQQASTPAICTQKTRIQNVDSHKTTTATPHSQKANIRGPPSFVA